jgi:hypothetical protein
MLQLYRSPLLLTHWIAFSDHLGWVMFPAKTNGWQERKNYRGDTAGLMRLPPRLGFNTGFPHPDATPVRAIDEHVFDHFAGPKHRRVA